MPSWTHLCAVSLIALTGVAGCSRRPPVAADATTINSGTSNPTPQPAKAAPLPAFDTCALLTADEIKNVIGEAPSAAIPSHTMEGGFDVSQCLFNLPTYSKSVLLSVTRRIPGPGGRDPRRFLEDKIAHPEEGEEEEEKPRTEPEAIEGLGDKAIWESSKVGSTLYVLKGNLFVRIAVGTFGGADKRKEKIIELARLAEKRL